MQTNEWVKIEKGITMPDEKVAMWIFLNDENGFNIVMGHLEEGVWYVYDAFQRKFRIYTRQQYVTHFKPFSYADLPNDYPAKKMNEELIALNA